MTGYIIETCLTIVYQMIDYENKTEQLGFFGVNTNDILEDTEWLAFRHQAPVLLSGYHGWPFINTD